MQQVSVDRDFARFGAKSYAINKITSVEVRETRPHAIGCAFALGALAILLGLIWAASLSDPGGGASVLLVGAAIVAGLGYWQWKRAKVIEYKLFLITSASETQAFVTRDGAQVTSLREQIETAMSDTARRETRP